MSNETLEGRLRNLLSNVRSRLEESAVSENEYLEFIFQQLKSQGLVKAESYERNEYNNLSLKSFNEIFIDAVEVDRQREFYQDLIHTKLNVLKLHGLRHDYYALENSPIPKEISRDIEACGILEEQTLAYLLESIGNNPIRESKYKELVTGYVCENIPEVIPKIRIDSVSAYILAKLQDKFDVKPDKEFIGMFTLDQLREALQKV